MDTYNIIQYDNYLSSYARYNIYIWVEYDFLLISMWEISLNTPF